MGNVEFCNLNKKLYLIINYNLNLTHHFSYDISVFSFPSQQNNGEIDLRVLIHQSLAGCVIGKGGSKIKEIRDVSRQANKQTQISVNATHNFLCLAFFFFSLLFSSSSAKFLSKSDDKIRERMSCTRYIHVWTIL